MAKLNISEILFSIQGEGSRAGLPCVFVRLQGCNLDCTWCDTIYAKKLDIKSRLMTEDEIISEIEKFKCKFVQLTGGEPLEHDINCLTGLLIDKDYTVTIETNGSKDISKADRRAIKIMDIKCPSSGMSEYNLFQNFDYLTNNDEIKFVIAGKNDFDYALNIVYGYNLIPKAQILFSPAFNILKPEELAAWILESGLNIRLQLQLHKFIWHPNKRGV